MASVLAMLLAAVAALLGWVGAEDIKDRTRIDYFDVLSPDHRMRLVPNACPTDTSVVAWVPKSDSGYKGKWRRDLVEVDASGKVAERLCWYEMPLKAETFTNRVCLARDHRGTLVALPARFNANFAATKAFNDNRIILAAQLLPPSVTLDTINVGEPLQKTCPKAPATYYAIDKSTAVVGWEAGLPNLFPYALHTSLDSDAPADTYDAAKRFARHLVVH